jgi:hypothetical protein
MVTQDDDNLIFKTAADFINNTNHPVFLTGKAGTGKTTFLKYIRENTSKNTAVVAPTGVAAINAGGTTIHSFFQLPFGPFLPGNTAGWGKGNEVNDKQNLISKLRLTNERKEVMQQLELLIIDEISMVRCDVLDAIDTVLRHVRSIVSKPFGGVQVLYIGDMYQLPPVVANDWHILKEYYASEFFFSSQVALQDAPVYIELKKVYRQTDSKFIDLLNQVRNNEMEEGGYTMLHSRFLPSDFRDNNSDTITLTTHNNKADTINNTALQALNGNAFSFKATIEGDFYEKSFPADENLQLKTGAQVMFIKNDTEKIRRYFNGKIGVVDKVGDDKIYVTCKNGKNFETIEVKKETWRNIKYTLNKTSKQIEEEELGSFTQYPLRLAWAITIHKSQGLTFEKAIIDAGNAFAPGQVYVALTRCTSLDGIILKSKISYSNLHSDERIVSFAKTQKSAEAQKKLLDEAKAKYQQDVMRDLVDFTAEEKMLDDLFFYTKQNTLGNAVSPWIEKLKNEFQLYTSHSDKFKNVLNNYFIESGLPENNKLLQERFGKAASWFSKELENTKTFLLQSPAVTDNRQVAKDYNEKLHELYDAVCYKVHLLSNAINGFFIQQYQQQKASYKKSLFNVNAYAGRASYIPSDVQHAELYEVLKDKRTALCQELDLPVYMVCSTQAIADMCNYLPQNSNELGKISGFGKVKLKQFGNDFISLIKDYCTLHDLKSNMDVLPDKKVRKPKATSAKPDTKLLSYDLFMQGKSIDAIATERNLSKMTIEGHLAYYIETGSLDINKFLSAEKQLEISAVFKNNSNELLSKIKELLPNSTYGEIKMMVAAEKFRTL